MEENVKASRYKLSLEEVENLLKAVYNTLEIQEEKAQLSVHDIMYQGLEGTKQRVFPVHMVLTETIKKEWKDPEKGTFFFPFSQKEISIRGR